MSNTKVIRVFPRRTKATPIDALAYSGPPDFFVPKDVEEVHISVSFTWDKPKAEWLAEQWERVAPVKVDGPAYRNLDLEFTVEGTDWGDGADNVVTFTKCIFKYDLKEGDPTKITITATCMGTYSVTGPA